MNEEIQKNTVVGWVRRNKTKLIAGTVVTGIAVVSHALFKKPSARHVNGEKVTIVELETLLKSMTDEKTKYATKDSVVTGVMIFLE